MLCPYINDQLPLKSSLTYMWGVEPITLTAMISGSEPPQSIHYVCRGIDVLMNVVNWRQVDEIDEGGGKKKVFAIQAANEPITWRARRLTLKYDDPVIGVPVRLIGDAIKEATGWDVVGIPDQAKAPYIVFVGNVIDAIKQIEQMIGRFAVLDHFSKTIIFTDRLPAKRRSEIEGYTIIEEGRSVPYTNSPTGRARVIVFGSLLKLPEDNFAAASRMRMPEYKTIDIVPDPSSWEIIIPGSPRISEELKFEQWISDVSLIEKVYGLEIDEKVKRQAIITKNIEAVFVATTTDVRQDEVLLIPPASVGNIKTRKLNVDVGLANPGVIMMDPRTGKLTFLSNLRVDVEIIWDPTQARQRVVDLQQAYSSTDKSGYTILMTPTSASQNATAGYYFGFTTYVIGKVKLPLTTRRTIVEVHFVNGVPQITEVIGSRNDATMSPLIDLSVFNTYIRENLLKHLKFTVTLDGVRIKFPYSVDSDGRRGIIREREELDNDATYIQNNSAVDIEYAESFARLNADLLNLTSYVGVVLEDEDIPPSGLNLLEMTKYIEDFTPHAARRIAYYRLKD